MADCRYDQADRPLKRSVGHSAEQSICPAIITEVPSPTRSRLSRPHHQRLYTPQSRRRCIGGVPGCQHRRRWRRRRRRTRTRSQHVHRRTMVPLLLPVHPRRARPAAPREAPPAHRSARPRPVPTETRPTAAVPVASRALTRIVAAASRQGRQASCSLRSVAHPSAHGDRKPPGARVVVPVLASARLSGKILGGRVRRRS